MLLWDACRAAELTAEFVAGRSFDDYAGDVMLRSAVERQLTIVGEALAQLRATDPATCASVPDLARIVGFRNVVVHGYAMLEDSIVWRLVEAELPELRRALGGLLDQA